MATAMMTDPQRASEEQIRTTPRHGPLLVATDGTTSADAALRAAHAIASRTGRPVEMIAVHVPVAAVGAEMQLALTPDMEEEARNSLRDGVAAQRTRLRIGNDWPLQVASGDPAAMIVRAAQQRGAALVIMGLGGHGLMDRVLGDELVLRVLRLGRIPVFAAAPNFFGLPKHVVAATDFSRSSVRALECAAEVMPRGGSLTIAHAVSRDLDPANWTSPTAGFSGTIGRAFDRVIAEIGFGDHIEIERVVAGGDPAKAVLQLVAQRKADLIVAGSHGFNFLTRLMLGSVSTKLVRAAVCSVLVAPPDDRPDYIDELPRSTTIYSSHEWAERLEEFSRRNMGRRATLEVIDPELGAQIGERDMVFVGASFDPRDACVQIMFGGESPSSHLTRVVRGVTAIQSLRDPDGGYLLLRVAHAPGQTLMTLER